MGRFLSLDYQALSANQQSRLESFVDNFVHSFWLAQKMGQEFDSTSAPWYDGNPYPAPAAKLALFEWYCEIAVAGKIRGEEHEAAKEAIQTEVFIE